MRRLQPPEFYGWPADTVAAVCKVSLQTAYHYKAGIRRPSVRSRELWKLFAEGRLLGDDWKGWQVKGATLVDPEGNATTQGQLRAYALLMQWVAEITRSDPQQREQFHSILRRAG